MKKERARPSGSSWNRKMDFDYLPNTPFMLKQVDGMFHFNTDTILLGEFIEIRRKDSVLDIGTNNGALLLYASLGEPRALCGVEIQEEAVACARANLELNNVEAQIIHGDVREMKGEQYDVIICNPPYFSTDEEGYRNLSESLRIARHEECLSLEELSASINRLMKDNGRAYIVYRASRLFELAKAFNDRKLQIVRMKPVYDENKENAVSVLLEIRRGMNREVKVVKPCVIQR